MQNKANPGVVSPNRFSVSIPPELEPEITDLKRTQFYNKSKADLIRHLLKKGLEAEKREKQATIT